MSRQLCDLHPNVDYMHAWGCPECVVELRAALAAANESLVNFQAFAEQELATANTRAASLTAERDLMLIFMDGDKADLLAKYQQATARAEAAERERDLWERQLNEVEAEGDRHADQYRVRAEHAEAERDTMRRSSEHNYEACVQTKAPSKR